jgi:hypothetical protein
MNKDNKSKIIKGKKNNETKIIEISVNESKPIEFIEYNRPINGHLVEKLKESMEKYGILSAITVYDAGDKFLLVDGQHRWTAAQLLGLSMPAIVIDWDAMGAIVEMNTIQKNWTITNFVDFYCANDDPQIKNAYSLLQDKRRQYSDLSYPSLAKIYGKPYGGQSFKEGKWRITDVEVGDEFISYLNDVEKYIPDAKSSRFIYAYTDVVFHPEYNHNRMMKKFLMNDKTKRIPVITKSNPSSYGKMLTKVYNFHQSANLTMFKASWI